MPTYGAGLYGAGPYGIGHERPTVGPDGLPFTTLDVIFVGFPASVLGTGENPDLIVNHSEAV